MLTVEGLSVAGRVSDVSFAVARGALHALVGPNGSGKSTVIDAVLGLVPYAGRVVVEAKRVAVVPQRLEVPAVLPMTVYEFLAAGRTAWPVALGVRPAMRSRVDAMLEPVQLGGFGKRRVAELSGGELRRVLLANALEGEPELLLLDEPEAGLDEASRGWLEETLRALPAKGVTTLWVSHDAARVQTLASAIHPLSPQPKGGGRHA